MKVSDLSHFEISKRSYNKQLEALLKRLDFKLYKVMDTFFAFAFLGSCLLSALFLSLFWIAVRVVRSNNFYGLGDI